VNIQKLDILEATPDQRRAYAIQFLGMDDASISMASDEDVISRIITANGGSESIFVQIAVEAPQQAGTPPENPDAPHSAGLQGSLGHEDPQVGLRIPNEQRNGQTYSRDVAVGVNGRCWLIQRSKDVTVPYRVLPRALRRGADQH
jgi:hypothetical protein